MSERNKNRIACAFFAVCFLITAVYLIVGYGAYLDSDMASELVLARHLADKGTLISGEWYYSTELRVLATQLVYTPLMAVFGFSWRLVRTLGSLVMLGLMTVSALFAAGRLGAKRYHALFAAGLLVMVNSALYAQFVIIGTYYVPYAVLGMLALGLCAGGGQKREIALMILLALLMGIGSIRYLLQVLIPLFAAALWQIVFSTAKENAGAARRRLVMTGTALCAGAAGYVLERTVISHVLHSNSGYYGSVTFADWQIHDLWDQAQQVIAGLLSVLGFEGGVPLFTAHGVANALVLLVIVATVLLVRRACLHLVGVQRFGMLTATFCAVVSAAVFVLFRAVYFERYWLPVLTLLAPVMAMCLSWEENAAFRRLVVCLLAGTALLVSALNIYHSCRYPQIVQEMRMEVVNAARSLGIDKGYATFWNANILTELSDGELDVVALDILTQEDGGKTLQLKHWLESEADMYMDRPQDPVFLLLGEWEEEGMEPLIQALGAEKVTLNGYIQLYIIREQQMLFDLMSEV